MSHCAHHDDKGNYIGSEPDVAAAAAGAGTVPPETKCYHGFYGYGSCGTLKCTKCTKKFGTFTNRRSHCRYCHNAVCGNCLAIKAGYKTCIDCQVALDERHRHETAAEKRRMNRAPLPDPAMNAMICRERQITVACTRRQQEIAASKKATAAQFAELQRRFADLHK